MILRNSIFLIITLCLLSFTEKRANKLLSTEKIVEGGIWVDTATAWRNSPYYKKMLGNEEYHDKIVVWFEEQFLGDGEAYLRRAKEFKDWDRETLRIEMVKTLKDISKRSFDIADKEIQKLEKEEKIKGLNKHWIINGFSCYIKQSNLDAIKEIPGVKYIFIQPGGIFDTNDSITVPFENGPRFITEKPKLDLDPTKQATPWNVEQLGAVKVWKEFNITGKGVINVVHDFGFKLDVNTLTQNIYRNPNEIPGNNIDEDKNGLIDDYHGWNFNLNSPVINTAIPRGEIIHGNCCAAIISGTISQTCDTQIGIAPNSQWIPVIASGMIETAIEWAIEHGADTYSMSFSSPGLGEFRSHWRKVMEQGAFCGLYFVSGAGNFANPKTKSFAPTPIQMRTPEDIPEVVFAAAGLNKDLKRPQFSSQGPVLWNTHHYKDDYVAKPAVVAFNTGFPTIDTKGGINPKLVQGNSFAGPHYCGAIALMLEADPNLMPWELKEIIIMTAIDVHLTGFDFQTGHGLIDVYAAVKEVLRRKQIK